MIGLRRGITVFLSSISQRPWLFLFSEDYFIYTVDSQSILFLIDQPNLGLPRLSLFSNMWSIRQNIAKQSENNDRYWRDCGSGRVDRCWHQLSCDSYIHSVSNLGLSGWPTRPHFCTVSILVSHTSVRPENKNMLQEYGQGLVGH